MSTPVDQYADIRALIYGLEQLLKAAQTEVLTYRANTRSKSFETDWGAVEFRGGDVSISLPAADLLAWAEEHASHEVIPEHTVTVPAEVRSTLRTTLLGDGKKPGRFRVVGDSVVDSITGEVVEWAHVIPAGQPVPVFKMPEEMKQAAARLVAERATLIAQAVSPELES